MRCLVVVLVLALSAVACGSGTPTYSELDSGRELSLDARDRIEIRLEADPSTGYSWEIPETPDPVVDLLQRRHEPAESEAVGSPGTDVLEFEAVGGAGVLRLEYIRPFDDPVVPERIVEFIIRVDGAAWPPEGATPPGTSTQSAPIEISELLDSTFPLSASVSGFLVWTDVDARLCEALAESFPPQCGGASVVIANPASVAEELNEEQATRWTDDRVVVDGSFDGNQFTIAE
jgi:predicted secreted protein